MPFYGRSESDLEAVLLERNSTCSISMPKSNNSKGSNSSHKSGKSNIFLQSVELVLKKVLQT